MTPENDDLDWPVWEPGYAWVRTEVEVAPRSKQAQWALGEVRAGGTPGVYRSYRPLRECSGLFLTLTFADVEPSKEGIAAFASRFGPLGRPSAAQAAAALDEEGRPVRLTGEPLELWRMQISATRQAAELWQLCQTGDAAALAGRIFWEKDADGRDEVYYRSHPGREAGAVTATGHVAANELIASATFHPERLARFTPGDFFAPALAYVQEAVNVRLGRLVAPRLVLDDRRGGLALRLAPQTLLGAIWLQFAQAVHGGKAFRRCGQCGAWFELSPQTARTNRLFCGGACRSKAHRGRRERACELHRQGKSVKEIARELDSDAASVKRWVAGLKD